MSVAFYVLDHHNIHKLTVTVHRVWPAWPIMPRTPYFNTGTFLSYLLVVPGAGVDGCCRLRAF